MKACTVSIAWALLCGGAGSVAYAQDTPAEYQEVLKTLGKQGDFKDKVLKINIPRSDLKVVVDGVTTPTPFGFGGWLAMSKGDGGHDVMMATWSFWKRKSIRSCRHCWTTDWKSPPCTIIS